MSADPLSLDARREQRRDYLARQYRENKARVIAQRAAFAAANPEHKKAQRAASKAKHKAAIKAKSAEYYQRNKQRIAERNAAYWKANPDAKRRAEAARRARKSGSDGSDKLSPGLFDRLLVLQRGKCANCRQAMGVLAELDHVTPLALGGRNQDGNMQLLCRHCNRSKHCQDPIEWANRNGRLL